MRRRFSMLLAALVASAACGGPLAENEDPGGGAGGFPSGATGIVKVRGDGQVGKAGRVPDDPLEVAVVDDVGRGVPGVLVTWKVESGGGTLSADSTRTDSQGRALTRLTLGPRLGQNAARARAQPQSGSASISLTTTFTVAATVLPVETVSFRYLPPDGADSIRVTVGDTIEFVNADTVSHTATAARAPEGGVKFDSGVLEPGQSWRFVPRVAGSWELACSEHPERSTPALLRVEE